MTNMVNLALHRSSSLPTFGNDKHDWPCVATNSLLEFGNENMLGLVLYLTACQILVMINMISLALHPSFFSPKFSKEKQNVPDVGPGNCFPCFCFVLQKGENNFPLVLKVNCTQL